MHVLLRNEKFLFGFHEWEPTEAGFIGRLGDLVSPDSSGGASFASSAAHLRPAGAPSSALPI